MKILLDENIPIITATSLRDTGHDVKDIRGTKLQGIDDSELWRIAQTEKRILITTDKGFTGLRTSNHFGLLVVLLSQPNRKAIHARVLLALKQHPDTSWRGQTVVFRDRVKSIFKHRASK